MNFPTMSRPSWDAQPPTFVRDAVRRRMLQVAFEIGGLIDVEPHHRLAGTEGALLLQEAGLLIMGTSQFRPLACDLAEDISARYGLDVLLLRFDAYQVSFDICMCNRKAWLTHYRRLSVGEGLWLVPQEDGSGPNIRADRTGLTLTDHPAYAKAFQREVGLNAAHRPAGRIFAHERKI